MLTITLEQYVYSEDPTDGRRLWKLTCNGTFVTKPDMEHGLEMLKKLQEELPQQRGTGDY